MKNIIWASALLMSVLLNIVLLIKRGNDADDVKDGSIWRV